MISDSPGWFDVSGEADTTLYDSAPVIGRIVKRPDSCGLIGDLHYKRWPNTEVQSQYVRSIRFGGSAGKYDGSGRISSDNATRYLSTGINFEASR
jgi:hypothetical protein